MSITVTGVAAVDKAMAGMEVKVQKKILRSAIRDTTKYVAADARRLAPVDTGTLESTIKARSAKRSRKNKHKMSGAVMSGQGLPYYVAAQELGTTYMDPNEFLRPALYGNTRRVKQVFIRAMRRHLAKGKRF